MVLRGSGIYCIVDTFAKVDNPVSVLKYHIIVLHLRFLARKNVVLCLTSNGCSCTLDLQCMFYITEIERYGSPASHTPIC